MKYLLKLYIASQTPHSTQAIENTRRICDEELKDQYELKIIDVLQEPQLAKEDKIIATPTLVKQSPPPLCRVTGDLSDRAKVLSGLSVVSQHNGNGHACGFAAPARGDV